jgi:hypothetical protein
MSNFSDNTFHPVTGKIEMAQWIDDHFGRHHYAVKFPNDDTYYDPFTDKCERVGPQAMKLRKAPIFVARQSGRGIQVWEQVND